MYIFYNVVGFRRSGHICLTYLFGNYSALICMISAFIWHELLAQRESDNTISFLSSYILYTLFIHAWGVQVQSEVFGGQTIAPDKIVTITR